MSAKCPNINNAEHKGKFVFNSESVTSHLHSAVRYSMCSQEWPDPSDMYNIVSATEEVLQNEEKLLLMASISSCSKVTECEISNCK